MRKLPSACYNTKTKPTQRCFQNPQFSNSYPMETFFFFFLIESTAEVILKEGSLEVRNWPWIIQGLEFLALDHPTVGLNKSPSRRRMVECEIDLVRIQLFLYSLLQDREETKSPLKMLFKVPTFSMIFFFLSFSVMEAFLLSIANYFIIHMEWSLSLFILH